VDGGALPGGPLQVAFLRSGFGGQLPQPYHRALGGASVSPGPFNDENAFEEARRVVPLEACDFVVELALPGSDHADEPFFRLSDPARLHDHGPGHGGGPRGRPHPPSPLHPPSPVQVLPDGSSQAQRLAHERRMGWKWRSLVAVPFLDAGRSAALSRALWLPAALADRANTWGTYHVMQRVPG
jgi:hypothetical protein